MPRPDAMPSFFVVGRDAAGMKGSMEAVAHMDDDIYKGEHARYVLQISPVLEDAQMGLISFDKFYYDKTDHTVTTPTLTQLHLILHTPAHQCVHTPTNQFTLDERHGQGTRGRFHFYLWFQDAYYAKWRRDI